jgi:DNA polymerase epsilon subunit 1
MGTTKEDLVSWLVYHKRKWKLQMIRRQEKKQLLRQQERGVASVGMSTTASHNLAGFLRQQNRALVDLHWQIIQIAESSEPGVFTLWTLVGSDLHQLKLSVPRVFYVNCRTSKELQGEGTAWRKVFKFLPRSAPVLNLSEYCVSESIFQEHAGELVTQLSAPDIEGVYETQVPLEFRAVVALGCVCNVAKKFSQAVMRGELDSYELDHLDYKTVAQYPYLEGDCFKQIYLYHSHSDHRSFFTLFVGATKKANIFVVDRVRTNQMPTMTTLYQTERTSRREQYENYPVPPEDITFDVRIDTEIRRVCVLVIQF